MRYYRAGCTLPRCLLSVADVDSVRIHWTRSARYGAMVFERAGRSGNKRTADVPLVPASDCSCSRSRWGARLDNSVVRFQTGQKFPVSVGS